MRKHLNFREETENRNDSKGKTSFLSLCIRNSALLLSGAIGLSFVFFTGCSAKQLQTLVKKEAVPKTTESPVISYELPERKETSDLSEKSGPDITEDSLSETEETESKTDILSENEVSKTYSYLENLFSGTPFYLRFFVEKSEDSVEKEYRLAVSEGRIYISDVSSKYSYICSGDTLTVMNDAKKTYSLFDISGTDFDYDNYLDIGQADDYRGVEFVRLEKKSKKKTTLTETFGNDSEWISFYYSQDVLQTVTRHSSSGEEVVYRFSYLEMRADESNFEVPAKYQKEK